MTPTAAASPGETTFVVPDLAQQTGYELGEEDDYTAPTHTDTEGTAVLFLGWTTTDNHEKIYDAGEQLPTLVSEVNIPAVATVYAVWAYDRNGDGTPDARQIMIQPADITIYTGGSSYERAWSTAAETRSAPPTTDCPCQASTSPCPVI